MYAVSVLVAGGLITPPPGGLPVPPPAACLKRAVMVRCHHIFVEFVSSEFLKSSASHTSKA